MKKLLPLLLLILIGCSSPEPEPINYKEKLISRNNVYYTKDTNKPYSGPVFSLHDNDNEKIFQQFKLKNGRMDGTYKSYYRNGQLHESFYKEDGKFEGPSKKYYSSGQIELEETYKDGKLVEFTEYYPDGRVQRRM